MSKTREQRQKEILDSIRKDIVKLAIKNEDRVGYVEVMIDEDFKLLSLVFNEGEFISEDFYHLAPKNRDNAINGFNIYYVILWADNKSKWKIKELVLLREIDPNELK